MPANVKSTITLEILGTGVLAGVSKLGKGQTPTIRIMAGVAIGGTLLLGLAEFMPSLAYGLGTVMFLTMLFVNGGPAWFALNNILNTGGKANG